MAANDPARPLEDRDIAAALDEIADLSDLRGDSTFKVAAYRRAGEAVIRSPADVADAYRRGEPPDLAGVGASISARIEELATSGTSPLLDELHAEIPPTLPSLLAVPGVGPRTAGEAWRTLGVATLDDLGRAAREGRLRSIRGISAATEERIAAGIEEIAARPPRRLSIAEADAVGGAVAELVGSLPDVRSAIVAGSVRRGRETSGDIDLLVETEAPEVVVGAIAASPIVDGDAGTARGADRASLRLLDGPQLDVMTMPPGTAGSHLVHFTGSAAHNVRLRQRAKEQGFTLSERGLVPLPAGDGTADGNDVGAAGDIRTFASEADLYDALGLTPIDPALREDRGEIEAALAGELPTLVERTDLRGDCHSHSHWSDGRERLEVMVESARAMGHDYLVISDHSQSLTIAGGLTPERVEAQRRVIAELNERFAREEAEGRLPDGAAPGGFRLLHGCELEITIDGRLDYEDELLAAFDVVLASLHVGRRQPRRQLMARYELAMRDPHVDIITHPSGRKIGQRPDLDLDWETFYGLAAETGTLLEVNGSPARLDLEPDRIRAARAAGCGFTVDSDAHDRDEWRNLDWGVTMARRGWLEARDVANTRGRDAFLELMAEKPHRL